MADMSGSTDWNPVIKLIVIGKMVNSTMIITLGAIPVPAQIISMGASVKTGMV